MKKYLVIGALAMLIAAAFVVTSLVQNSRERSQAEINVLAQYGPVKKEVNAVGQETATRATQVTTVEAVAKQDSKLGIAVAKEGRKTRSATYVALETAGTVAASPPDPVDSTTLHFTDEWVQASVTTGDDTVKLDYRVRNELEIYQVNTRTGLFSPDRLEVKVRNLNPHSTTTDVQSFAVDVPRRRVGYFIVGGFIAGAVAVRYGPAIMKRI